MKFKRLFLPVVSAGLVLVLSACGGTEAVPDVVVPPGETAAAGQVIGVDVPPPEAYCCPPGQDIDTGAIAANAAGYDADGFALTLRGTVVNLNQNMTEVISALGEPLGVHESPSCAFDGYDRIFMFPGVQIHTFPQGDQDFVHIISIMDDSITTPGGIFLGSSWDNVLAAYGDDYEHEHRKFTFTRGNTALSFFVDDGTVYEITFELLI